MELLFFDREDDGRPARVIPIDPAANRTYHYWHVFVPGRAGRADLRLTGLTDRSIPRAACVLIRSKLLLDPYGRAVVVPKNYSRDAAGMDGDNTATAMKSVVVDPHAYDWEGDAPLSDRPAHAPSSTRCTCAALPRIPAPASPNRKRGTYAGLIEKIPYLQQLGITAVELLPVFQFDAQDAPPGRVNYWGYAPVSFFAPHQAYSSRQDPLGPRGRVSRHGQGAAPGRHRGHSRRSLQSHGGRRPSMARHCVSAGWTTRTYYILERRPLALRQLHRHRKYSQRESSDCPPHDHGQPSLLGRGNARGRFPVRSRLDSRARFVRPCHVEPAGAVGHRIRSGARGHKDDRGSLGCGRPVSGRQFRGRQLEGVERTIPRRCPRLLPWRRKIRWHAWPTGFSAAPSIYGHEEREAEQSVNFVTCHDGFTLNDLVSYNQKHNEENGEGNRDGADDNRSWNCGVEGPSDDPAVETLRNRQVKNFLTVTMLSLGVPMIVMGDEVRRTQRGNNNAYCQDNETSWFDWTLLAKHADVHRFVRLLIARRLLRDVEHEHRRISLNQFLREAKHAWHGVKAESARLGTCFAQPGTSVRNCRRRAISAPDLECILGTSRI